MLFYVNIKIDCSKGVDSLAKKVEEKAKVGRPKLADPELIKDSWYRIAASLSIVFVLVICGVGVLTARTPLQVLTFQNADKLKGNVVTVEKNVKKVRVIPAKKLETRVINADGTVTRIIPAK